MLLIPIQSVSDIITNSSSEVFCTITANEDTLERIFDTLRMVIKEDCYDEYEPCIKLHTREDILEDEFFNKEELLKYPGGYIQIDMPYGYSGSEEFYKAGIKALLDVNNIKDYKIKYE